MPPDPYTPCICGSGKKFRWCCAPYYGDVEKAFEQERQGQHEAALHTIKNLLTAHGTNPSVWFFYAQFLYNAALAQRSGEEQNQKIEQAEEALSKALELNPTFGMAHFLRAQFRENEGELRGALLLYRKAVETFDPHAHDQLAAAAYRIYQLETMFNRPVAARAALERCVHFLPAEAELRREFEEEFGPNGPYPEAARKKYTLRPTAQPIPETAVTGRLSDAKKAYDELTQRTPDDPAAWFNLGVVRAWLSELPEAVAALVKSIELETDDYRAEEAGALAEVLRCGHGMENASDHVAYTVAMPIRDPQPVMQTLQAYSQSGKLRGVRVNRESGMMMGYLVEELPTVLAVGAVRLGRVTARLTIAQGLLRLTYPNRELLLKAADELRTALQLAVEQPVEATMPLMFSDVAREAMAEPLESGDETTLEAKLREYATDYFENTWLHRPLHALAGNTPLDAMGSKILRKHVFGVVQFLEQCFALVRPHKQIGEQLIPIDIYDFNRLRHKLAMEYVRAAPPVVHVPADTAPAPATPAPRADTPPAPKRDIAAMNAAELAALDVAALSVAELEQAMVAAVKLDARELAVAFAQAGLLKPFDPAFPDRYRLYATAITGAATAGDIARAAQLIDEGTQYDAEHNRGQRATDYRLRKAQLYVKAKDAEKAAAEFETLVAMHPDEGRFYTTAAEEMLRLKDGAKALRFAEAGLAAASRTGNRDLEGHCRELVEAAKKAAAKAS
ncbi:MAG: tetratricopeptide repeat protein [Gemmataceae bacterium]|nr:tetratricopeptide repeat protein [Gemmata sp.]MDW8198624.1 tetratricopeptide repeat protein [Gemmataceae bacterium]